MVRALINLAAVGRVAPMPFLGEGAKPIAWVEIGGDGEVAIHGAPSHAQHLLRLISRAGCCGRELAHLAELLTAAGGGALRGVI